MKTCADIEILPIHTKGKDLNEDGDAYFIFATRTIIISSINPKREIQDITESLTHETIHYVIFKQLRSIKKSQAWDTIITKCMNYDKDRDLFYGCYFEDGETE